VNDRQKTILIPKLSEYFDGNLKDKRIAVWGLSFKPETDDIREAPAVYMIDALLQEGANLQVFDPEAINHVQKKYGHKLHYADSMYDALKDADALIISTEWNMFRTPDFELMKNKMKQPVIFDGRNLYKPERMQALKFDYISIGRPKVAIPRKLWKEF
jgi:UDPglucose 6-dehydrogenase